MLFASHAGLQVGGRGLQPEARHLSPVYLFSAYQAIEVDRYIGDYRS